MTVYAMICDDYTGK